MDAPFRDTFVVAYLPVVRSAARKAFAGYDPEKRDELTAEAVASAFVSFMSLVKRGCVSQATPGTLAFFAIKHARAGRHVGGSQGSKRDALTPRPGVTVTRFGTIDDLPEVLHEALADNTRSPVPEQAAFRIDFPDFLARQPEKKAEVALLLAQGHRARDVARAAGVSPGRVTQIRQELSREWAAASA